MPDLIRESLVISATNAICINIEDVTNTSRYVTWLSSDIGLLYTLIKGSQRPKSIFLGQYDLFYTCELQVYDRSLGRSHILKECSPLVYRPYLRNEYKSCAVASYMARTILDVLMIEHPQPLLFKLLTSALDALEKSGDHSINLMHWFEVKVAQLLGMAPHVEQCVGCRKWVSEINGPFRFAFAEGALYCKACSSAGGGGGLVIGKDVTTLLSSWKKSKTPSVALQTRCTDKQHAQMDQLLGQFLRFHVEIDPSPRLIAMQLLKS